MFEKRYGKPVDNSSTGNGKKYSIPGGLYITNYAKNVETSTLLIQGKNSDQLKFVMDILPDVFKEVLTYVPKELHNQNKRKNIRI